MLRIQKGPGGDGFTTFLLSGRIRSEHLDQLTALLQAEHGEVVLDLKEVRLVSCEVVRFLASCESRGAQLCNCPAYIREWILRERSCHAGAGSLGEGF